jgi:hypothetical protein
MDIKIKQLQPSSDNYLSDSHFLTHLSTINAFVENFFTINLTNYTIKLPKLKNSNCDTIIIPIRIISFDTKGTIGHTNVVVYDKKKCVINLFEPHGKEFMGYNPLKIDISGIIHYYINELLNVKATLCKVKGLQGKQNSVYPNAGHCTAWSLLFVDIKDLNFLNEKDPVFLDNFIRKYITFVKNSCTKLKLVQNIESKNITKIKININQELIVNYIMYLFDQFHLNSKNKVICNEILSFKYYYTEIFNKISQEQKLNFLF